jgi:hypothetical protein
VRNNAVHSSYLATELGTVTISPDGEVEAGSPASWELTFRAGRYGIDDTGSLKVVYRFVTDMGRPQFDRPADWNYTTAEAGTGALLELRYDPKGNLRPWDKTIVIRLLQGTLREGDTIVVRLGDTRFGSPGMRAQTFHEPTFEFKMLVDAFATYNYVELPHQPCISIVAGRPVLFRAVLPTLRRINEPFAFGFKAEDRWGNPSHRFEGEIFLESSLPMVGLPRSLKIAAGSYSTVIKGLCMAETGVLTVTVRSAEGRVLCVSNPLRSVEQAELLPYWADLHGQSEETIGTNSARELIEFARDRAFLDVMCHQGNDFQITKQFWEELNRLTASYNRDGEFIIFPGYEWSGNTGLGGDRNVMFLREGQQIHRSHHACLADLTDVASDAASAADLFQVLKDTECVVFAHVGGRYADIGLAHDPARERSIEIHSDWGTFEWLLEDAFSHGYRVGILANSDGHKGRHGASHPGASQFGAYGGLTCLLARELNRPALFESLRTRRHYATTGCRALLDTSVRFVEDAGLYDEDPAIGGSVVAGVREARMGDIVTTGEHEVLFEIDFQGSAPIERIELRNGPELLETWRPYDAGRLGRRIRIVWEGAEYRGRGRETVWDGSARLSGNAFEKIRAINRWNPDKPINLLQPGHLEWEAVTTGGFGGFEAILRDRDTGVLRLETPLASAEIAVRDIALDDLVLAVEGGINRRIRLFRLPDDNPAASVVLSRKIVLRDTGDNPLYVCVTLEDGHRLWSSPIYVIRGEKAKR